MPTSSSPKNDGERQGPANPKRRGSSSAAKAAQLLPLLPLCDIVVFPHMVVPLYVGREKSIRALDLAMAREKDREILLCAQKKAKSNDPTSEDLYATVTIGEVIQ